MPKVQPERSVAHPGRELNDATDLILPESRDRRLLELRLLHHYDTETSPMLHGQPASDPTTIWTVTLPQLALKSDTLLHSMLAVSALHLSDTDPTDLEAKNAHHVYLNLALKEHHDEVKKLGKTNVDVICLTSSMMRIVAFRLLQDRPLVPYAPPNQWLQMTKSASYVFQEAWELIKDDENSIARRIAKKSPEMTPFNASLFQESNRQGLLYLLRHDIGGPSNEVWVSACVMRLNSLEKLL